MATFRHTALHRCVMGDADSTAFPNQMSVCTETIPVTQTVPCFDKHRALRHWLKHARRVHLDQSRGFESPYGEPLYCTVLFTERKKTRGRNNGDSGDHQNSSTSPHSLITPSESARMMMMMAAQEPQVQALLLDMDGVMAEVSLSYRKAIVETAQHFGAAITLDQIEQQKLAGNANNDWQLTHRLIHATTGAQAPSLEQVTQVFEEFYQGVDGKPGLCELETLLTPKGLLQELHRRLPKGMAVVTGRPRKDCEKFLAAHGYVTLLACVD